MAGDIQRTGVEVNQEEGIEKTGDLIPVHVIVNGKKIAAGEISSGEASDIVRDNLSVTLTIVPVDGGGSYFGVFIDKKE